MVTGKLTCSASTETGIPTAPNAVGTVLATSDAIAAFSGLKPRAISIPMGIATAVPYPDAASRNPPKHHEIRSTWIRLSSLTLAQSFGLLSQQIAFNIIVRIWSRLKIAYFNSIRKYLACYLSDLCAIWSASCRLLKVLVN